MVNDIALPVGEIGGNLDPVAQSLAGIDGAVEGDDEVAVLVS